MKSNAVKSFELEIDWTAQTILPIEFDGRELHIEARAYQGTDPAFQALVLVHRHPTSALADPGTSACGRPQDVANGAGSGTPVVRVHSGCVTGDIFHSLRCDCYPQLQAAMQKITTSSLGVLIYLPYQEGRGIGLVNKIRAYALQDQGYDTVDANVAIGAPIEARDYDLAAHILFDLGFPEIKLLTNNPAKVEALRQEGVDVIEQLPLIVKPSPYNVRYLATKKERMAHKL
jgi:GTP cyclohydrolase II/3,4-dihydroxy 2-butanone 4-phosphate synthase/GTP cyclohydrolase II